MSWKVLKNETDYQTALKRAMDIFEANEGEEADELDLLLVLIKDYEDKHIHVPQLTPAELHRTRLLELRRQFRSSYPATARPVSNIILHYSRRRGNIFTGSGGKKNSVTLMHRTAIKSKKK